MKVKTHFKQMFLVDNVFNNEINNNTPSKQIHHTTLQIPPTTLTPSGSSKPFIPPPAPSGSAIPPTPSLPSSQNELIKKDLINNVADGNNSNQQDIRNMKPFEVEGNQWLDKTIQDYNFYNDMSVDVSNATQPTHQFTNQKEQMQPIPQLPSIQPTAALSFDQAQTLPPAIKIPRTSQQSQTPAMTFDQLHPLPHPQQPIPMEYQQSQTPALTFNQPRALPRPIPTASEQQSQIPAMTFNQPLALDYNYPTLEHKQPIPLQQSQIPAIEMNQCHECDGVTPSQKALPPPKITPQQSLPAPSTYPALTGPQSTALVLPTQEAGDLAFPLTSSSTLQTTSHPALTFTEAASTVHPPPTLNEAPSTSTAVIQPAAKHVVKYENYTYKKPSRIPEMTTYICERCNTHFKKQSSLINHNKRFHAAFDQTEKGKKRESNEEITHGVRKITKMNNQKRKRIQNSSPNKRFLTYNP